DMKRWLAKLTNNNAQGEYYITDIIALAYQEGREIVAVHPQRLSEVEGVNNRLQLSRHPDTLLAARSGSPLVIGLGMGENFIASDQLALLPVTRRFIFLEEGDIAEITRRSVNIFDKTGAEVKRQDIESNLQYDAGDKGIYRHYMQKEIYE
ncbi:hypothetical protein QC281_45865, partial [Streptomyces sp. DH17]|nr:hypothetical protein [Streptomyces sp. DH17]